MIPSSKELFRVQEKINENYLYKRKLYALDKLLEKPLAWIYLIVESF
jgi:hypothetical protein